MIAPSFRATLRGEFFCQDEGARSFTLKDRVFSDAGALHDHSGLHLGRRVALQLSARSDFGALTLTNDESPDESLTCCCAFILAKKLKSSGQTQAQPFERGTP